MRTKDLKVGWLQSVRENRIKNGLLAVLIVTNLISATGWFQSHETVVLVPSTLTEKASVSQSKASETYVKAWALHVAELVGNISPGNADFVLEAVGDILSPTAYRSVRDALVSQIADIKTDSLTVSFEPRQIVYEGNTRKVFVYGQFSSRGSSGDPIKMMRTYEMMVEVRFGRPWVTNFVPYAGDPKTEGYWKTKGQTEAPAEKAAANLDDAESVASTNH